MTGPQKLFANYQCPKCRGRSFMTEEVCVRNRNKRGIIRPPEEPYLLVVCGLCGFTEMYSQKVLASLKEEVPAKAKPTIVKESETV